MLDRGGDGDVNRTDCRHRRCCAGCGRAAVHAPNPCGWARSCRACRPGVMGREFPEDRPERNRRRPWAGAMVKPASPPARFVHVNCRSLSCDALPDSAAGTSARVLRSRGRRAQRGRGGSVRLRRGQITRSVSSRAAGGEPGPGRADAAAVADDGRTADDRGRRVRSAYSAVGGAFPVGGRPPSGHRGRRRQNCDDAADLGRRASPGG